MDVRMKSDSVMSGLSVSGTDLSDLCPEATHLMALLGEPVDDAYVEAFVLRYGTAWLQKLINPSSSIQNFWNTVEVASRRDYWELLEILLLEHWITSRPLAVARKLSPDRSLDREIVHLRGRVALALYSRAKSVNWQEPLTFVRALRISELYLRSVLEHQHLLRAKAIGRYKGRLGVALVLQARYTDLGVQSIAEAAELLRDSIARGNTAPDAFVYLAEALLRHHDATGEAESLVEVVKLESDRDEREKSDLLGSLIAEAWFRLSQDASTIASATVCRERAGDLCSQLEKSKDPLVRCRIAIVHAFLEVTESEPASHATLKMRGLRTPFGTKPQVRQWKKVNRTQTLDLLRAVGRELGRTRRPVSGSRIHRSLAASISSEIAGLLEGRSWREQRVAHLREAVVLRSGPDGAGPLTDPESRLESALDRFDLYRSTQRSGFLLEALADVLSLIEFDQAWATPLLVLAREIEAIDGRVPVQVAVELRKKNFRSALPVLAHVLTGDAKAIYSLAAERALESREIDRKHLGGRSGVYLAEDYSGIVSETFVFKPTTQLLADREASRVKLLERHLEQLGLRSRFSVPATLAQSELPPDDVLRRQGYEVLVARQFHHGSILPEALRASDLAVRTSVLDSVGQFLAAIQAFESSSSECGNGMRRDLREKEVGRWLRSGLQMADWDEQFAKWWDVFGDEPHPLARKDAHPLNWLMTPGRTIVAVDFEACGWRPAGYELAQLLDDKPLLPVDKTGWKTRMHLLRRYRRALNRAGVSVEHDHMIRAWEASTAARAVGALTSPSGDAAGRLHAEELLTWIAEFSASAEIRDLATAFGRAWGVRRGAMTVREDSRRISDARRRHLSRSMAFELRHGSTVLIDDHGWGYLASVSDALNRSGLRTSPAEVEAVASAIDEPRFEVVGKRVRARYGHTREVRISYDSGHVPATLYHGTASINLIPVFTDGEGLQAMGRQWVHLSSDPNLALRTAERHGPGVLLAIDTEKIQGQVFPAGGPVYLTTEVPASALRIVTPTELFLTAAPDGLTDSSA